MITAFKIFETYIGWGDSKIEIKPNSRILSYKNNSLVIQDGDSIIKKFKDKNDLEYQYILKYFPLDDTIFPKIYKINDLENEITMELLSTKKAESEVKKINKYLKKEYNTTLFVLQGKEVKIVPEDLNAIYNKYQRLITKIKKMMGKHNILDIHSKNFGYDKDGNLKMIDI